MLCKRYIHFGGFEEEVDVLRPAFRFLSGIMWHGTSCILLHSVEILQNEAPDIVFVYMFEFGLFLSCDVESRMARNSDCFLLTG